MNPLEPIIPHLYPTPPQAEDSILEPGRPISLFLQVIRWRARIGCVVGIACSVSDPDISLTL